MFIQCTKKLLDELGVKPAVADEEESPLLSWHANVMTMNRKKAVVLTNDRNRYRLVLYGLKAKAFKKLDEWVVTAIRQTFQEEGIHKEVIDRYFELAGEVTFTKTKNRTLVARLNRACDDISFFQDYLDINSVCQPKLSKKVSRLLVGDGGKGYLYPNEEMYKDLKEMTGKEIFESKAAVLKVTLELENQAVWRRLIVPVHYTLSELHDVLQEAFCWQNYHQHEFYIIEAKKGIHMEEESGIKLSEYVPSRMKYIYDFGDHWVHDIVVEEVIDHYDKNHPVCLAGEGNTPPEDVGGETGYEEFLRIITDPKHPDYTSMREWGYSQGYKKFNLLSINAELKG